MKTLFTKGLKKSYAGRNVVKRVSLTVKTGEVVGLLGPNGAGKTTIFYMVVGLVSPDKGKVFLDHHEMTDLPIYRRHDLGWVTCREPSIFRS
jgi:lipopolysaccharide export system ATP-binding protein